MVWPGVEIGSKLGALQLMLKTMVTRAPDLDRWESERGHPHLAKPVLAHDSVEWRAAAEQKRLALLETGERPSSIVSRMSA
ncbi:MAG: hypothetical protein CL477_20530 [Acidobacteria bacterium]|nr:hypothetical protein [Acidobacteriota bacterium]MDP7480348.1 hypothetical protein [Vicinamibacterales bacterium]HJN43452.1 hypothetical protein [Vicinamibacterales bacterium]